MQFNSGNTSDTPIPLAKVIHSKDVPTNLLPANTVFVDRGSPYSNPFVIGVHGERAEVCDRFDVMIANDPDFLQSLDYLRGKNLITFHAPYRSHADTLLKLAVLDQEERLEWADNINTQFIDKAWSSTDLMNLAA